MFSRSRPTNAGCDFSLCGIKSNLSDFSYDGLKQVSVFKVLKVTLGLMESRNGLHVWVASQRLVMMSRGANWSALHENGCLLCMLPPSPSVFAVICDFTPSLTSVIVHVKAR